MSTKKKSDKKTNSGAQREMREKREAEKAAKAKQAKGKKSPAPAKKAPAKKQPADKAAKSKKSNVGLVKVAEPELLSPADLRAKTESANALIADLKQNLRQHCAARDKIMAQVGELQRDSFWRFCKVRHEDGTEGPYASWSACTKDIIAASGYSRSTVMAIISLVKATPQLESGQRSQITARKAAKLSAAAKVAEESGRELPPEVVNKAVDRDASEDDLVSEIERHDLGPKAEPEAAHDDKTVDMFPPDAKADPLLAKSEANTLPESPRKGGSGEVNGKSGTAAAYHSTVQQAITACRSLYMPEASDAECLERICGEYLNLERMDGKTNIQALDNLKCKGAGA